MSFIVKWTNPVTSGTREIYRSDNEITEQAQGTLLATVPGTVESYTDNTAVPNKSYYYQVVSVIDDKRYPSPSSKFTVRPDTGPGPQELVWGDSTLGYFGAISENDLGFPLSRWRNDETKVTNDIFHKVMRNGRVLYVMHCLQVAPVNTLIARGVFNSGVISHNSKETEVKGVLTLNGRKFAPRVAKFFDRNNTDVDPNNYKMLESEKAPFLKSEVIDFIRMLFSNWRTTTTSPFALAHGGIGIDGNNCLITSDFGNEARSFVYGWNSAVNPATAGLALRTNIPVTTGNFQAILVIEYLGV